MNKEFLSWYENNHISMRKWNEQREINERKGLEKFYKLKEMFDKEREKNKKPNK